jgi:hypothetical protein
MTTKIIKYFGKYFKTFSEISIFNMLFILSCIFLTYIISEKVLLPFNFYYDYKWLDIPVHMLGAFLFTNLFLQAIKSKYIDFRNVLIFILFIGIGWEFLEYIKDVINLKSFVGWADTLKDLLNDILGAYLAFLFYKNK